MKKNSLVLTLIAAAIISTGCSSVKLDKAPPSVAQDRTQMQTIPEFKNEIPEWFKTENTAIDKEIVVTATDKSKELQFAIDKAMINARVELASRLNVEIQSLVRESTNENGGAVEREIDRVSKLVTKQTISMYHRDKMHVSKEGEEYRAFVLLKMRTEEARRVINAHLKVKRDEKFNQLDNEIAKQKND
jgi:PBP1b-binding outer membrane lipoprotein LpoB